MSIWKVVSTFVVPKRRYYNIYISHGEVFLIYIIGWIYSYFELRFAKLLYDNNITYIDKIITTGISGEKIYKLNILILFMVPESLNSTLKFVKLANNKFLIEIRIPQWNP